MGPRRLIALPWRMATPRSRILIAAAGVVVLAGATLATFGTVGCGEEMSAASTVLSKNRKTPGVYITSVESFGAGFAGFVRDANPGCR
jgi:hypothetical protein